jgi:hypothetical protein
MNGSNILPVWRTSSRCGESGQCVEVALLTATAGVRDSADPPTILTFPAPQWTAFLDGIRAGDFELE